MKIDRRGFAWSLTAATGAIVSPGRVTTHASAAPARSQATAPKAAAGLSPARVTKIRLFYPPNYDPNGAQTFGTALAHLDKFAYVGGFSGSSGGRGGFDPKTSNDGVFADAAAFNKKVKVLFLGIGSAEGPGTKTFSDNLTQAGIKNIYYESPGTAHEWLTWRRSFKEFAPLLFR